MRHHCPDVKLEIGVHEDLANVVFTLWPKEVREAVFNLKGGERQLTTSLPALQIQFMYPFISFSSFCSSFKSRKPALDSTLSFSFANSLYRKQLFVHQAFAHTEKKGKT